MRHLASVGVRRAFKSSSGTTPFLRNASSKNRTTPIHLDLVVCNCMPVGRLTFRFYAFPVPPSLPCSCRATSHAPRARPPRRRPPDPAYGVCGVMRMQSDER